jgi:hypothetical protein
MAALEGVALELEVDDADPDAAEAEVALDVAEPEDDEAELLELPPASVALSVPHFWFFLQPSCPCASLGWAAMHCTKVCWQM